MSYSERLIKGSIIIFSFSIATAFLSYLTRVFLARSLSVEEFGLFYAIMSFINIIGYVKEIGFSASLQRFIGSCIGKGEKENIFPAVFSVILFQTAILIILFIPIIAYSGFISLVYFKNPSASLPLIIMFLTAIIGIYIVVLQNTSAALGYTKIFSVTDIIRMLTFFSFSLIFIGMGVLGVSYAYLLASIFGALFLFFSLKYKGLSGKLRFDMKIVKSLAGFGVVFFAGSIFLLLLSNIDTIIITFFKGTEEVGYYHAAITVNQLIIVPLSSLLVLVLPLFAELWEAKKITYLSDGIEKTIKLLFLIALPFLISIFLFSDDITFIFFGASYIPASIIIKAMAISSFFYFMFGLFSSSLAAVGDAKSIAKFSGIIFLINALLNLVFVPFYGAFAAAMNLVISYLIGVIFLGKNLKKKVRFRLEKESFAKIILSSIFASSFVIAFKYLADLNVFIEAFLSGLIYLLLYSIFVIKFGGIKKEEIIRMKNIGLPIPNIFFKIAMKIVNK